MPPRTRTQTREPYKALESDCIMYPERTGDAVKKYHDASTGSWKSGERKETQYPWYFTKQNKAGVSATSSKASSRKSKSPRYQKKIRPYGKRSRSRSRSR